MKKIFLLNLCLMSVSIMYGQKLFSKIDISWSSETLFSQGHPYRYLIWDDISGLYLKTKYNTLPNKEYITKLDYSLTQLAEKEFIPGPIKSNATIKDLFSLNNKLYIFTKVDNKKQDKNCLYIQEYNLSSMDLIGIPKMIAEIDYSKSKSEWDHGGFKYMLNQDSSLIGIMSYFPEIENIKKKYNLAIYDKNFNVLSKITTLELPYINNNIKRIEGFSFLGNNTLWSLATIFTSKENEKNKQTKQVILQINSTTGIVKEYPIDNSTTVNSSFKFLNVSGKTLFAGFVTKSGQPQTYGVAVFELDTIAGLIKQKNFQKFELDNTIENIEKICESLHVPKNSINRISPYNLKISKSLIMNDGSVILISEQIANLDVYALKNNNAHDKTIQNFYLKKDIIASKISPSGDIEWVRTIPKLQMAADDYGKYTSFISCTINGQICFVYTDNLKMHFDSDTKPTKDEMLSNVSITSINKDGSISKETILSSKNDDFGIFCDPTYSDQVSSNKLLLKCTDGKIEKFALIKFN